jgi:DNA ligase-1
MAGFDAVAMLAEEMAAIASKLQKRAAIAEAIIRVHADAAGEEGLFCLYLAGLPFAEADPRKLNAGGALLSRAVLRVSGAAEAELTAAYRQRGDLGAAGFDLLVAHGVGGEGLALGEVEAAFAAIASARTTAVRAGLAEELLRSWRPSTC